MYLFRNEYMFWTRDKIQLEGSGCTGCGFILIADMADNFNKIADKKYDIGVK